MKAVEAFFYVVPSVVLKVLLLFLNQSMDEIPKCN